MRVNTHLSNKVNDTANSSLSRSNKFIRKSQSQQFNSYQNMLNYDTQSRSVDKSNNNIKSKPLSRKNSQQGGRFHSLDRLKAKAESVAGKIPSFVPSANPIEDIAMHMCAHIFLKATTRFYQQYKDLSSLRDQSQKKRQRKRVTLKPEQINSQQRQATLTPKKAISHGKPANNCVDSPTQSITSILKSNTPRNKSQENIMTLKNSYSPIPRPAPAIPTSYNQNPESSTSMRQNHQLISRPAHNVPVPPPRQPLNTINKPKTSEIVEHQPLARKYARTPENNAYHMAGHIFMNSSTRFIKQENTGKQGDRGNYSPPRAEQRQNHQRAYTQPKPQPQRRQQVRPVPQIEATPTKSTIGIQSKTQLPAPTPTKPSIKEATTNRPLALHINRSEKSIGNQGSQRQQSSSKPPEIVDKLFNPYQQRINKVQTEPSTRQNKSIEQKGGESIERNQPTKVISKVYNEKKCQQAVPKSPFTRQPAKGGRSPLAFANKASQQTTLNTTAQPAVQNTYVQRENQKIKTEPAERINKGVINSPAVGRPHGSNNDLLKSEKPAQKTNRIKINQQKKAQDNSGNNYVNDSQRVVSKPVAKNNIVHEKSSNILNTSKSDEAFNKLWKPAPQRTSKPAQSQSITMTETTKNVVNKHSYTQTSQKQLDQSKINESSNKIARKQNFLDHNVKKAAQQIIVPRSPQNKHPHNRQIQPVAKKETVTPLNTNRSTNTSNISPRNNVYQPQTVISPPRGQKTVKTHQQKAVSPPVTQPTSTRSIPHSDNSLQNSTQIKSQSRIDAKSPPTKNTRNSTSLVKTNQSIQEEASLKRSSMFAFLLSRLIKNTKNRAFQKLKQSRKYSYMHSQEAVILGHSIHSLSRSLELNIYKQIFCQLKKYTIAGLKATKEVLITPAETKQKVAKLLNSFVSNKKQDALKVLKKRSWEIEQLSSVHQSTKMTPLRTSQENAKNCNYHALLQLKRISNNFYKSFIRRGFDKIYLHSVIHPKNVKQSHNSNQGKKTVVTQARSPPKSRDLQQEKRTLLTKKQDLQSEISTFEYSINDKRRFTDREKNKLIKKMEELKKKNESKETVVTTKRHHQNQLKKKISMSSGSGNEQSQLPDIILPQDESFLGILTRIYSDVFKSTDQTIDVRTLVAKYNLNKEYLNTVVEQWATLVNNMNLKRQLAAWQGTDKKEGSLRKALTDERKVETDLMKNYVRERYLWEWVHVASGKI